MDLAYKAADGKSAAATSNAAALATEIEEAFVVVFQRGDGGHFRAKTEQSHPFSKDLALCTLFAEHVMDGCGLGSVYE